MPKPDPVLLDPARYPFTSRIDPRFGDLDVRTVLVTIGADGPALLPPGFVSKAPSWSLRA